MIKWIREALHFVRVLFIPGKPHLETEIEIVQLLAVRGEVHAMELNEYFNEDFDYDNPQPYVYVSFALIYSIMLDLEDSGVVRSRMADKDGRRRMLWRLTGRGPRKKSPVARPSFQPASIGV